MLKEKAEKMELAAVIMKGKEQEEEAAMEEATVTKICFGRFSLRGFPSTTSLMHLWGQLHNVRSVLGMSGFLVLATTVVMRNKK